MNIKKKKKNVVNGLRLLKNIEKRKIFFFVTSDVYTSIFKSRIESRQLFHIKDANASNIGSYS